MPYVLTLFGKELPIYGICFYIGIVLASAVALVVAKKRDLPKWEIVYAGIFAMIGAMIGAKVLFIIISIDDIIRLQLSPEAVIKGGFVFYGGLLGGFGGLMLYVRLYKLPAIDYLDICATVLPLGHAVGRVGCFFGGCCYGIPYDGPGCVVYEETVGMTPLGVPLLPVQLIEGAALLVLFGLLMYVLYRKESRGLPVWVYCLSYSVIRFVLEYFRGDGIRGKFLWLSTSQWISILIIIVSVVGIFLRKRRSAVNAKVSGD